MSQSFDHLRLLGDPTRLRILHLLRRDELSVAELQEALDMGQSRISSHLSLLKQGDLVTDRKDGKRSFYSLSPDLAVGSKAFLEAAFGATSKEEEIIADRANLDRILTRRRQQTEQYFNEIAGRLGKNYCPGRTWEAIGHLLFHLTPRITIADLGAGEGVLSQLLARRADKVWCIDNSPRMVEVGTALAREQGIENLEYRLGDIEKVPLENGSVDLALLSQALHHAEHPRMAVEEAYRILRPGGQLLLLDLVKHDFEKARELYADRWLGFTPNQLYQWFNEVGFTDVQVDTVAREAEPPHFQTVLAVGQKR